MVDKLKWTELYGVDKLDNDTFSLNYKLIDKFQQKDHNLVDKLKRAIYQTETFCGGKKKRQLICKNGKIVIPDALQKYVLNWYHTYLLHPGSDHTERTIAQHFFWPTLRSDVRAHVKKCGTCQRCKKSKLKYGHLPVKEAEATPWDQLSVNLIGPYKIER